MWQVSSDQNPTKEHGPPNGPLLTKGVTWSNRMSPHYYTSPVLHGCLIDRSESTRQHEVKTAQRDDGHVRLTSGRDHVATV
jgi:hypothetical protein